ncbi:MAG: gluconate 2-dehydrogenase subunit 3 family protein [Acidiferrobacteraceae bacterium]
MSHDPYNRYPGYNVLDKRYSLSWDEPTRQAVDRRMAVSHEPRFFSADEWRTLDSLCKRILPQPSDRTPIPLAALLDAMLLANKTQGYRCGSLPYERAAWKQGLAALDAEARDMAGAAFHELTQDMQDQLLMRAQTGGLRHPAWEPMSAQLFFNKRILSDIPAMYYAHPAAWNEIGFGGPASPRGYVRMELNRRDPWEPVEARLGQEAEARVKNRNVG